MEPEFFLDIDAKEKKVALMLRWAGRNSGVIFFRSQDALKQFLAALQEADLIDTAQMEHLLNLSQYYAWLPQPMTAAETTWFAANDHLAKVVEIKEFIAE